MKLSEIKVFCYQNRKNVENARKNTQPSRRVILAKLSANAKIIKDFKIDVDNGRTHAGVKKDLVCRS